MVAGRLAAAMADAAARRVQRPRKGRPGLAANAAELARGLRDRARLSGRALALDLLGPRGVSALFGRWRPARRGRVGEGEDADQRAGTARLTKPTVAVDFVSRAPALGRIQGAYRPISGPQRAQRAIPAPSMPRQAAPAAPKRPNRTPPAPRNSPQSQPQPPGRAPESVQAQARAAPLDVEPQPRERLTDHAARPASARRRCARRSRSASCPLRSAAAGSRGRGRTGRPNAASSSTRISARPARGRGADGVGQRESSPAARRASACGAPPPPACVAARPRTASTASASSWTVGERPSSWSARRAPWPPRAAAPACRAGRASPTSGRGSGA